MQTKRTITRLPRASVEIKGSISWEVFEPYRERALKSLQGRLEIDGFRAGTAPLPMVARHAGDMKVLEEMAQEAIADAYPTILTEEKIDAIGRPNIVITKLATQNELEFTITTDVLPTIKLGNYKKSAETIMKKPIEVTISEEDIEKALKEVRQMRAHQKMHDDNVPHDSHNHQDVPEDQLPALDDAFAQSIGKFTTLDELKEKIKENLKTERERVEHDKRRGEILEGVIGDAEIDIPNILVDAELDKMVAQFSHDIAMSGMSMDDYLKRIQKTMDVLKTEWRDQAEKRAKIQLALDTISEQEKIIPSPEEIQAESEKIMDMYKDHKDVAEDRVRAYVTQILTNTKVLDFLEGKNK